ncbi:hypothetical protein F2P45_31490 [Massilia sp. CCM 8733]|uniref:Porin domain-containing protein n=1 Tax=Massilia mucilaginosa TaxID=2609282 RepID=A0ABX0P379_9BURK|nr:hypothetical protein [Massilia mucilaginosa]NHZ93493.1 hypothetical protein [Massilia mucilaginosa]
MTKPDPRTTDVVVARACIPAALLAALLAGGAHAADPDSLAWTFGGFGTAAVSYSDNRQADFGSSVLKASGAGYSDAWSPHVDSRLGAQLGVTVNKQWSGVVQVITEQRLDRSYRPLVEWANVKYQATPDLSLRVGRIALPIFLAADYRKIGYAYPWARTPGEVYGALSISSSDGVDASYRWKAGGLKLLTQAFVGGTRLDLYQGYTVKARKLTGVSTTADRGAFSSRVSAFSSEVSIDLADQLFDGFNQFGPPGQALARQYGVQRKRFNALTIGAGYDPGNWFVMAEVGRFNSHSFLGKTLTGYAGAGYRVGAFTPYLSYAASHAKSPTRDRGLALDRLPPPLAAPAAQLNAGLNYLLMSVPVQNTVSAGVRWEARRNVALKLQYDRLRPGEHSRGTLLNVQPGFGARPRVNLASAVLDFVF